MNPKIYFISGVCGVGKSAVIPYLKKLLPDDKYNVRDFDERGVPDGAGHEWRKLETKKWLEVAADSAKSGVTTIVCGFVKTADFEGLVSGYMPDAEVILLDADAETIRRRLIGRYTTDGTFDENQKVIGKPVNEFIESNVNYCKVMREECGKEGCKIIETTHLTPEEVSRKIIDIIQQT